MKNNIGHQFLVSVIFLFIKQLYFHPWEGGEGKVIAQHLICNLELAKQLITEGDYNTALGLLDEAENYPPNLGEEKLVSVQENDIHYWKGLAYERLGNNEMLHQYYSLPFL